MGLERRQDQGLDGRARRRRLARRLAVHARGRRLVALERAGDPKTGNPIRSSGARLGNYKIEGQRITADVKQFDPTIFKWMAFLTGYVLPKAYYTKVGAEGFEKKPIGTGPYMVDEYQGNAFLRLKRNDKYWGGKPRSRRSCSSSFRMEPAASPRSKAARPT
jgi:ABC-type transport system substrate-binding protein